MTSDKRGARISDDPETIDAAAVETYLKDHPAFFRNRPDLLLAMQLPHGPDGVVSLVERQVALLRERNIDMRRRLAELHERAEQNDSLFAATRALVLALLATGSDTDIDGVFAAAMKNHYQVGMSRLLWLPAASEFLPEAPVVSEADATVLAGLISHGKSLCGVLRQEEMATLFGTRSDEGSAAVAPLRHADQLLGVVAVGDSDANHYQAGDGTLFLDYLADVIVCIAVSGRGQTP